MNGVGYKSNKLLVESGKLKMTIPEKLTSISVE